MSLLSIKNLDVGYGEIQVLRNISIDINDDECVGLIGPNGHGKTTMLKTISGLLNPWNGEIYFKGKLIDRMRPSQILELGLVHVPQGNTLFSRMTVFENLIAGAYTKRNWRKASERTKKVFEIFPKLAERKNQLANTLSGGERQMLAIGAGLMVRCDLIMLDEPTLGLSPLAKSELKQAIKTITQSGVKLLLVEQDFDFMSKFSDRFYMIESGSVVFDGVSDTITKKEIAKMYFNGNSNNNNNQHQISGE